MFPKIHSTRKTSLERSLRVLAFELLCGLRFAASHADMWTGHDGWYREGIVCRSGGKECRFGLTNGSEAWKTFLGGSDYGILTEMLRKGCH